MTGRSRVGAFIAAFTGDKSRIQAALEGFTYAELWMFTTVVLDLLDCILDARDAAAEVEAQS